MDDVRRVLAREFPDRTVSGLARPTGGNRKRTVVATLDDGERVVVQFGASDELWTEAALARLIDERTVVPVPRVRAVDTLDGARYVLADAVAGADLHEEFTSLAPATRREVTRTLGRWLAALHDLLSFDGYGAVRYREDAPLCPDRPVEAGAFEVPGRTDWEAWVRRYATEGLAALPTDFDDLRPALRAAFDDPDLPPAPPARLFPWDYRPGNALVDDGRVTAVLDWGDPLAAAPGLSLAKAEHLVADWYVPGEAETLRRAFREGYAAVAPLPDVPRAYRLAAVVHSAVDSRGEVTRPGYPERRGAAAVAFHRDRLTSLL
jgi:Ser/Thr protein kinase RdoA (MazF antagonist)